MSAEPYYPAPERAPRCSRRNFLTGTAAMPVVAGALIAERAEAKKRNVKLLLPVDHVVAMKAEANAVIQQVGEGQSIPVDKMALDIGPKTIELFSDEIATARTIVWNGPMGVFEIPGFSKGTFKVAHAVADNGGAISIVGGGDSVAAVKAANVADKITHISTGGGASLEFLEGQKLPGVEALSAKSSSHA